MADLNLPPNVKRDPNTGLYRITNAQGKTVRVSADTQDQLNQYVKSVDTGVPATVTITDPNTGNPRTQTFDSAKIIAQTDSINRQNELLTAGKRQAGVLGNSDGSYQDVRTGKTISQGEAAAKIQAAGLPAETLQAVTPKNSPSYQAAQNSVNSTTNTPSNIPAAAATAPSQSGSGTGSGPTVDASVPAVAAQAAPDRSFQAAAPVTTPQGPPFQPFDPAKASVYNKLVNQGLSPEAAEQQAGISPENPNYGLNQNGTPATNPNYGKLSEASVRPGPRQPPPPKPTPEELADDAELEAEQNPPPGSKNIVSSNYTNTSTETVSGGGSRTTISGPKVSTAGSEALQPAINAKQAEIDAFQKANPGPVQRKREGLPALTPEENLARIEKQSELVDQKQRLVNGQTELKADTPPTVTVVPNTTTTTQTVVTGTSSVNSAVNPDQDENLSNQTDAQLATTTSTANAATARSAAPVDPADDPFEQSRLDAEAQLNNEPAEFDPADVNPEDDPFEAERLEREQELNRQELSVEASEPEPVDPADDPFEQSRLDAEQEFNDEPIEFEPADVDPADDPFEAERLEREQELNRQELSETATEAEPVDAEQLGNDYGFTSEETEDAEPTPLGAEPDSTAAFKALVKSQGTLQSRYKQPGNGDWRVRLSLAPYSDYLYNATGAGILAPLTATNGVIFPYTPNITTTYTADYEKYNLIHSNYRGLFYKSSSVGDVQIRGTFTAQDTKEAAYMLAVIHFFRSVTKMFYGQDAERGTPPPLVYLSGYGDQQFSSHPCVVGSFNYSLPNEVDYIRTNAPNNFGPNMSNRQTPTATSPGGANFSGAIRLANALLNKGAIPQLPAANALRSSVNNTNECTYVPTKMEIDITLIPVQTRSQVSKQFSLKEFANGNLLKKGFW